VFLFCSSVRFLFVCLFVCLFKTPETRMWTGSASSYSGSVSN
jgi:hypothetical protein